MYQNIQVAHNRKSTVVLTRTGHPPGNARSRIYYHASAASLRRLERLAEANSFDLLPTEWRNPDWWQREKGAV